MLLSVWGIHRKALGFCSRFDQAQLWTWIGGDHDAAVESVLLPCLGTVTGTHEIQVIFHDMVVLKRAAHFVKVESLPFCVCPWVTIVVWFWQSLPSPALLHTALPSVWLGLCAKAPWRRADCAVWLPSPHLMGLLQELHPLLENLTVVLSALPQHLSP